MVTGRLDDCRQPEVGRIETSVGISSSASGHGPLQPRLPSGTGSRRHTDLPPSPHDQRADGTDQAFGRRVELGRAVYEGGKTTALPPGAGWRNTGYLDHERERQWSAAADARRRQPGRHFLALDAGLTRAGVSNSDACAYYVFEKRVHRSALVSSARAG